MADIFSPVRCVVSNELTFSQKFLAKYGHVFKHYHTLARFLEADVNMALVPKFRTRNDFILTARTCRYHEFCVNSDQMAMKAKVDVMGRLELEAAWIRSLFAKFDKMDIERLAKKYRGQYQRDFLSWAQVWLRKAIKQRNSTKGIENYWIEKDRHHRGCCVSFDNIAKIEDQEEGVEDDDEQGEVEFMEGVEGDEMKIDRDEAMVSAGVKRMRLD